MDEEIMRLAEIAETEAEASMEDHGEEGPAEQESGIVIPVTDSGTVSQADFGDAMIAANHVKFIDGAPAIWDGMRYQVGQEAIHSKMLDIFRKIRKSQRGEVMSYLELRAPRVPMADPRYIAFENGVLDIETMELLAPTPELAITSVIPHDWNPYAECPEMDSALRAWTCGREDRLALLLEAVGLCMYRGREFQSCILLLGSGANGKSTFLNLLTRVIGEDNVSSLELRAIGKRFQSVALMGKLANITDDISSEFVKGDALAVFKKVVTGDMVSAEYKGGATFKFRPYCTVVISANEMPRLEDYNDGIMRRLAPILFEAKFTKEQGNLDINLPRVLDSEAACQRLLYSGVMALREALERGALTVTADRDAIVEEIHLENSSVYEFAVEELCFGTEEAEEIVGRPTGELFSSYRDFCFAAHRQALAHNSFTQEMCRIYGVKAGRRWTMIAGKRKQVRCFVGR